MRGTPRNRKGEITVLLRGKAKNIFPTKK